MFTGKLKPFLDAVAGQMDLYVPKKTGAHYVFSRYDPDGDGGAELNNVRVCTPAKEFLFPLRELAAVFPEPVAPKDVGEFAVFGLKDCDLRSIEILDKVFIEDEFEDPFYTARRDKMFVISSDCFRPAESCFCSAVGGESFARSGFDLNVSQIDAGFIVEAGSVKGEDFIEKHAELFTALPDDALSQRELIRAETRKQLEQINAELKLDVPIREIVENSQESDVFDAEAKNCIECQACTRVCPTCHCFYLYDTKQKDYFGKMKMWDSCMRLAYAGVAGGENPRKVLGERIKHRLMHKFSYFLDRYGVDMCVGCGRCVDADAGGMDIRVILKRLRQEYIDKEEAKAGK